MPKACERQWFYNFAPYLDNMLLMHYYGKLPLAKQVVMGVLCALVGDLNWSPTTVQRGADLL